MAALGEIVFHQILAWHHFYDRSTRPIGLLSSGLWHTAELLGLVAGFMLYAGTSPRRPAPPAVRPTCTRARS
ncbi:DUF2243 domain-containing protein [Amycolatopsis palatopharyngis]|uniref:DUF2243 domain-containing protein n=1 Tax=Amycolatopsis palatopharyngis TaxID=187982 RepID=UPI000E25828A|nr:DUF2243 domain-containing protein [Amycolatopsis palatopharyngis]